jgi:hypothetical protein
MNFFKMFLNNYQRKFHRIPSVNPSVIKNIIIEGYTDEMEQINLFFITNGFTDGKKITDERFTDEAFPSVN